MNKKMKAIVLGGTDDHITLIENLKNRGYYTILIDYHDNPPAKKVANLHIKESTLNQEKVLEIAKELEIDLVISACIDQALLTSCYVAEKLNLPAPFSYQTALNVTNKGYMKKRMVEVGIPTSKHCFIDGEFDFVNSGLKFPVMVKPADSNGSYGVKKAKNVDELNKYLLSAIKISRTSRAIVEEFKEGMEVSIDCFIHNKKARIIMTSQLIKNQVDESTLLIYQSIIPAAISKSVFTKIENIANQIADAFNLDNTPLLIQTIVNEEEVNVIEFSPRIGGTKHKAVKSITGFDILNATIDSFLGNKVIPVSNAPKFFNSKNHIYTEPGIFGDVKNYKELINEGIIEEFVFFKTKGMEIGGELASRNRIGSFIVKAETKEELFKKIEIAVNKLEVYDVNGVAIMRKDIFQGIKL